MNNETPTLNDLSALERLEAREVLQLLQLHRRRGRPFGRSAFAFVVAVQAAGHRYLPLQLAEAPLVLHHGTALLADLVMGQAVGEVLDLRRAALLRGCAAGVVCSSRCGGEGAHYDGENEHGSEVRHGAETEAKLASYVWGVEAYAAGIVCDSMSSPVWADE